MRAPEAGLHTPRVGSHGTGRGDQPTLTGERVRLRPWRPEDAAAVFAACQDADIQRWTQVPVPYLQSHAEGFVTEIGPAMWDQGGALFAVEPSGGGALIASIGVLDVTDGVAEIGYWTVAAARGRGYTAEALGVLSTWALEDLGCRRIELHVDPANLGSRGVAERAGFTAEGVLRQRFLHRGRPADFLMYSLLATDPRPRRGAPAPTVES